jgi:hypothetical protein
VSEQLTRELIERLAEVLGTTAPVIWAAYLRQQAIAPIVNCISVLLAVGLTSGVVFGWWQWAQRNVIRAKAAAADDRYAFGVGDGYTLVAILLGLLSICGVFCVAAVLNDAVLHLMNPEYYAIDALLRAARGGK